MVMGTVSAANLTATLHYIESDTKTKVLARPRVLTQNNEAATIQVVTNEAIGVETTSTPTGGSTTTTTGGRLHGITPSLISCFSNNITTVICW